MPRTKKINMGERYKSNVRGVPVGTKRHLMAKLTAAKPQSLEEENEEDLTYENKLEIAPQVTEEGIKNVVAQIVGEHLSKYTKELETKKEARRAEREKRAAEREQRKKQKRDEIAAMLEENKRHVYEYVNSTVLTNTKAGIMQKMAEVQHVRRNRLR